MKIRLLAIDLDGTLLTRERRPHPESTRAIRRAIGAGVTVALASGRVRPSMRPFAEEIGLEGPMVCGNGAHVLGPNGDEILHDPLPADAFEVVRRYAEEEGVHLNMYTRHELLFLHETPWGDVYRSRVAVTEPRLTTLDEIRAQVVTKAMIIDDPESIPRHKASLAPLLGGRAHMTESEPEYLEFLSPSADKGTGLRALAEFLGIAREETAAIGDYLNDLGMLRWAGLSAAMGNAAEPVKQAAQRVMPTNDEGGVGTFIDTWVLHEGQ